MINRFEAKFIKGSDNECWEWKGALQGQGYGHFKLNGKVEKAHRISYKLYKGGFPEELLVLHSCDNPSCVNPSHLFLGTHQTNNDDKENKKRGNHIGGEKHYKATLTTEKVKKIRELSKSGIRNYIIADMFKIHKVIISRIILNQAYKEI